MCRFLSLNHYASFCILAFPLKFQPLASRTHIDKVGEKGSPLRAAGCSLQSRRDAGQSVGEAVITGVMVDQGWDCLAATFVLYNNGQKSGTWPELPNRIMTQHFTPTWNSLACAVCTQLLPAFLKTEIHPFSHSMPHSHQTLTTLILVVVSVCSVLFPFFVPLPITTVSCDDRTSISLIF